jgi:hypothetical protein
MLAKTIAAVAAVALATPALANGAISEFRGGGVTFKETTSIGIAREDLYMSAREIRVHYVYESSAEGTQRVTMGFPMPPVPLEDGPDYLGGLTDEIEDMRNYMQFAVEVDGRPVETILHEFAYLNGYNVTEELRAAKVPPFMPVEGRGELIAGIDDEARARLVEQGFFLGTTESFEFWQPMWHYQAVYEWEQDFAPGETEVDVRYVPLNGYPADIGMTYEGGGEGDTGRVADRISRDYCIDDKLVEAIKKRQAAGEHYEVVTQGYIVRTAQYWHNAIGTFMLIVDKADPALGDPFELVAFCPLEAEKISQTQFRWSAENYWADQDIAVVYYNFYGAPE